MEPDRFRLSLSSRSTTVLTLKEHTAEPSQAGLRGPDVDEIQR